MAEAVAERSEPKARTKTGGGIPFRAIWWAVFLLCLSPAVYLLWQFFTGQLFPNPIEAVTRGLGDWALRVLLLAVALTPIATATGWTWPVRVRRMVGLFAFTYVVLHVMSYVGLDQFFFWPEIWADIVKRTYITAGMAALLLLIPLAATSTSGMIKRLGAKRWKALHKLVYIATPLALLHFWDMIRADFREPAIYSALFAVLMLARVPAVKRRIVGLRQRA